MSVQARPACVTCTGGSVFLFFFFTQLQCSIRFARYALMRAFSSGGGRVTFIFYFLNNSNK